LEKQIADLDLSDNVKLAGWVLPDKVPLLLNTASLVVIPSRAEGFGLVALQAALMARPVVAARVGGLLEVLVNGETGLLVEPEQQAIGEAVSFLLARPEVAAAMGREARRRAVNNYSFDRHVNAYDDLYRKVILESNTKPIKSKLPCRDQ
jgi:glycogen(starch) synthase